MKASRIAPARTQVLEWASDQQKQAFEAGPAPLLLSGGWGSGKTYAASWKGLWLSDRFPGNRGLIARKVARELAKTTMATFFKLCPPHAYDKGKRNDNEGILTLNNGSQVLWMHLDDPDVAGVLRGLEINWFILDQAEEVKEEIFDLLMGRLGRWDQVEIPDAVLAEWDLESGGKPWPYKNPVSGKPIPPVYPMMTCNPDTELHWLYRRFHPDSQEWREKWKDRDYRMIHMPSGSNRFLPEQNLSQMREGHGSFVRRFVDGVWGIPEGVIHVIDQRSIVQGTPELLQWLRNTATLHRVLDHGDAAPTCCAWAAVDREGNVWVYREYYVPGKLISHHRSAITSLSEGEKYIFNLCDPSMHVKTMQKHGGRWSVADEYADIVNENFQTALFWQAADNNELGTRNRVNEYLKIDPERIHPITKEKGAPRLFFLMKNADYPNGCDHIVTETRSQRYVKVDSEGGRAVYSDERDANISDHGYDTVRYLIASRPPIGHVERQTYGRGSFMGVRNEYLRWKKAGHLRKMWRDVERAHG